MQKKGKNLFTYFVTDLPVNPSYARFILSLLFFFSGCAALIYQVMWQRMLFTVFGIDLESITIIVAVFMFGLGLGGLLGGYVADKMVTKLLGIYITIEFLIGVFGLLSPYIIEGLGDALSGGSQFTTLLISFLILVFPTM